MSDEKHHILIRLDGHGGFTTYNPHQEGSIYEAQPSTKKTHLEHIHSIANLHSDPPQWLIVNREDFAFVGFLGGEGNE